MVNGLGFACGTVCLATWVSLLLPIRHMGAGMGLYGIVNALAIAVGPALGIRLQAAVGYQWTFIASLTLNVCAFVTVLLVKTVAGRLVKPLPPSSRYGIVCVFAIWWSHGPFHWPRCS